MASEQPCYTIINSSQETEGLNEQQIKHDLGLCTVGSMVASYLIVSHAISYRE